MDMPMRVCVFRMRMPIAVAQGAGGTRTGAAALAHDKDACNG